LSRFSRGQRWAIPFSDTVYRAAATKKVASSDASERLGGHNTPACFTFTCAAMALFYPMGLHRSDGGNVLSVPALARRGVFTCHREART